MTSTINDQPTMNDRIWGSPDECPAVREINRLTIERSASDAAALLTMHGFVHVTLEPDDGTRYEMVIVAADPNDRWSSAPYRFSSSMGTVYPWMGNPSIHPDYAQQHYVANGNRWTATVFALFLNTVAEAMRKDQ